MFNPGQQIGPYLLVSKLGRGGFGEVWLAEKRSQFLTKKVAIKLPHDEQVDQDAVRREAEVWEQASGHPNVLPIIDADIYDGQVVIVSEYADGGSLADVLRQKRSLSVREASDVVRGVLSGLEFLHNRNIIHRDIKPQNILLQGNTPRLADFGISRVASGSTMSSVVVGTDAYMAPEAFDGKRNVQTDVWSVGVVYYQLLKGALPFPQDHPSERMFAVLTKQFEPLPPSVPENFRYIVERALAKDVAGRYGTASEMLRDVEAVLSNTRLPSRRNAAPANPPDEQMTVQRPVVTPPPYRQPDSPRIQQDAGFGGYQPTPNQFYAAQPLQPIAQQWPAARDPDRKAAAAQPTALAGLCYLGYLLFCLPGLIMSLICISKDKSESFARFHGFQSLLLWVVYILFAVSMGMLGAATSKSEPLTQLWAFVNGTGSVSLFVCLVVGAVQGFRGKKTRLPVIGHLAEKWS